MKLLRKYESPLIILQEDVVDILMISGYKDPFNTDFDYDDSGWL